MKYFLICFIDYKKDDIVTIKDSYMTKNDATNRMKKIAVDHIKKYQGKQQAKLCDIGLSPELILSDNSVKNGMYIYVQSDNKIQLYEKVSVSLPGTLWNYNDVKVNKIGVFVISEYHLDDQTEKCNCMRKTSDNHNIKNNIETTENVNNFTYIDELRQLFSSNDLRTKLKPVNKI